MDSYIVDIRQKASEIAAILGIVEHNGRGSALWKTTRLQAAQRAVHNSGKRRLCSLGSFSSVNSAALPQCFLSAAAICLLRPIDYLVYLSPHQSYGQTCGQPFGQVPSARMSDSDSSDFGLSGSSMSSREDFSLLCQLRELTSLKGVKAPRKL